VVAVDRCTASEIGAFLMGGISSIAASVYHGVAEAQGVGECAKTEADGRENAASHAGDYALIV
jgi:hypothetical protein